MYRLVIADDKPMIRKALEKSINWGELGCEVVGVAENGIEAKEMCMIFEPDILMTDIKMPGLNGIELVKSIKTHNARVKVILITGYQDFEVAQEALRLGVVDLLLKPLNNQNIIKLVQRITLQIERENSKDIEFSNMEYVNGLLTSRLIENHNNTLTKFLIDVTSGMIEVESTNYWSHIAKLQLDEAFFQMVLINYSSEEVKVSIIKVLKRYIKSHHKEKSNQYLYYLLESSIILVILNIAPSKNDFDSNMFVEENVENNIIRNRDYNMVTSIQDIPFHNLRIEYVTLINKMSFIYFKECDKYDKLLDSCSTEVLIVEFLDVIDKHYESLYCSANLDIDTLVDNIIFETVTYCYGNIDLLKVLLSELCIHSSRIIKSFSNQNYAFKSLEETLDRIQKTISISTAKTVVKEYIVSIIVENKTTKETSNGFVREIKDYIDHNYRSSISLSSLSKHFGINSSYLSRLIKSNLGANFIDILTSLRMDEAKRLLRDSDYKISQIGEKVGYKDYTYFYQVFKKITGSSPKDYRKKTHI